MHGERLLNAEVRVGDFQSIEANTQCGKTVGSDVVNKETLPFDCNGPVQGRYVSIQLKDRQDNLHVCEVQVMAQDTAIPNVFVNIAEGKTATQSSDYQGNDPNRAIDGNTNSAFTGNSCSHTEPDHNAWWRVDLGQSYPVYEVVVTNRQDCCLERLLNAEVRVGDFLSIAGNKICGELVGKDRIYHETMTFHCDKPVLGRYVSIQINGRVDNLHVCEVQVIIPDVTRLDVM
ncbi:fucolectin-like [Glandiceps talaboti]